MVKATFRVESIEYTEGRSIITFSQGKGTWSGFERTGIAGVLRTSGHAPVPLSPGQIVIVTVEPAPPKSGSEQSDATKGEGG